MEYVYAAMLLHSAQKEINEKNLSAVLESAGIKVDSAKVKALVASLKDVNIDEAIKQAVVAPIASAQSVSVTKEEKAEKTLEEEKKTEEEAAAGLGSLFG